ncbi:MAG: helix-turn-helix transcriptional regulator [Deltaproteobacteria bacterium]|nr:helix-turn-helix transcriptional regulator [Deltaproteobacteria bacterium]MBW2212529.1 helix-turn-helix transcriptional regulator [Deltaproteobacteria bacterium]MBW2215319.1 helix-turn-helix transcriptional regulator [Deltaproteobacteria bacterium]MBW2381178.1 helix-turn-helix transcriptional regulator [Deltaproteobacteria bacterium]MBW2686564.1 helix-turn-helix transcriptional regulator [Deltaproteobacteria bacterium]
MTEKAANDVASRLDLPCSVARSLEVLSDRWVFLILREAFFGEHYYDGFRSNLGIATNILSSRLKSLVDNGVLAKQADESDARRIRYSLTEKGLDLYSVTVALIGWGDKWLSDEDGPPLKLHHKTCGHRLRPQMCCKHCGKAVRARDVSYARK